MPGETSDEPEVPELWSYREIAAYLGVQRDTVRSYRKHGMLPPPDETARGRPYWRPETVRVWVRSRPGYRGPGWAGER